MQSCSECGATLLVFGDDTTGMCRSCRVKEGAPAERPFQRIGARRGRRMLGVRTAGLLVALAVVVATVVSLRGRVAEKPVAPAASKPRERVILGGHTVEI